MPTRSTKLASARPPAGVQTVVLTVPNGFTYIWKSAQIVNPTGAGDLVAVYTLDVTGIRGAPIYGHTLTAGTNVDWEGWIAVNPGEQLAVFSSNGNSDFWMSGAKLPGVA